MMIRARNLESLISGRTVEKRVMYMQYREKIARNAVYSFFGTPVQILVLDSLSYFCIIAFISSCVVLSSISFLPYIQRFKLTLR